MKTFELYEGKYKLEMHPANHRYLVNGEIKRGVTGILSSTIAKEGLALWPLDEAMKYLFGQEFEEMMDDDGAISVKPTYNETKAYLKSHLALTPALLQDALEAARAAHTIKRDKGADVGSRVHYYIEQFLTAGIPQAELESEETEVKKAVKAFLDWYETEDLETVLAERPIYSEIFDYCGTPDHIARKNGKLIVIDYKTTNYSRTAPLGIYSENFAQIGAYAQAYMEEFKDTVEDLWVVNVSKQGKVSVMTASEMDYGVDYCINIWLNILAVCNKLGGLKKRLLQFSKAKLKEKAK